jgi:pyruvate formate lyase activating enzyme
MLIGGLQKFSLLDYPDHIAAIIFTQGCNFRCPFCYNPMLVWPFEGGKLNYKRENQHKDHHLIEEDDLFAFLRSRAGRVEAIVITGGEPTIHSDLSEFAGKIKEMGFLVKLDTNGTNPEMVGNMIKEKLIDYIAMDIKNSPENYENTIKVKSNLENIKKTVKIIMESSLPYEFRTTLVPGLIGRENIEKIGQFIKGAEHWYLQNFKKDTDLLDEKLENVNPLSTDEMKELAEIGKVYVKKCEIR